MQHQPFNVEPGLKFVERREKSSFSLRLNQLDEGAGGGVLTLKNLKFNSFLTNELYLSWPLGAWSWSLCLLDREIFFDPYLFHTTNCESSVSHFVHIYFIYRHFISAYFYFYIHDWTNIWLHTFLDILSITFIQYSQIKYDFLWILNDY